MTRLLSMKAETREPTCLQDVVPCLLSIVLARQVMPVDDLEYHVVG